MSQLKQGFDRHWRISAPVEFPADLVAGANAPQKPDAHRSRRGRGRSARGGGGSQAASPAGRRIKLVTYILAAPVAAVLLWWMFSGKEVPINQRVLPATNVLATLGDLLEVTMPDGIRDAVASETTQHTRCFRARFRCGGDDLAKIIANSPNFEFGLESGRSVLRDSMFADISWWRPDGLTEAAVLEADWQRGVDSVHCVIQTGAADEHELHTVYVLIVIEPPPLPQ